MASSIFEGKVPRICVAAEGEDWPEFAARHIAPAVSNAVRENGTCSMVLTGGATAERLYSHWNATDGLPWESMRFFFGDERCVPPESSGSNYAMSMRCLRPKHHQHEISVTRMAAEAADLDAAARQYDSELPAQPDVLLLGMGIDGHVASLFPRHPSLMEMGRRVVCVTTDTEFPKRLTMTPFVISAARSVFLLATGAEKGKVLTAALQSPADVLALPVRFSIKGTWLLDHDAGLTLSQATKL